MAWEWVAPLCTAVVGVAGVAGTLRAGSQQRRTVSEIADEQRRARFAESRRDFEIANLKSTQEAMTTFVRAMVVWHLDQLKLARKISGYYNAQTGVDETDEGVRLALLRLTTEASMLLDEQCRRAVIAAAKPYSELMATFKGDITAAELKFNGASAGFNNAVVTIGDRIRAAYLSSGQGVPPG